MTYDYYICDVFTDRVFGGNPLAVIPDARGLTDQQMQQIAREFNFSESTFVFPPSSPENHREVRIFTPSREVPFAGHPNVGTAFALTATGDIELKEGEDTLLFEEKAGLVSIAVSNLDSDARQFTLTAPESLSVTTTIPVEMVSLALGINPNDVVVRNHMPVVATVGLAFVFVEVRNAEVLASIKMNQAGFEAISELDVMPDIHVYTRSRDEFDIRSRMFAPFDGVNEDPATGSANSALAALLADLDESPSGQFNWKIAQGVEMNRPSILHAFAEKQDGTVTSCGVGGQAVMFSKGQLSL